MTDEQAQDAMRNAVDNGSVDRQEGYVNDWENAANDMWDTTDVLLKTYGDDYYLCCKL